MKKLLEELAEKRSAYNKKLTETRSLASEGKEVEERFAELDTLKGEIEALEARKVTLEKLEGMEELDETDKRFNPKKPKTTTHVVDPEKKDEVRAVVEDYVRRNIIKRDADPATTTTVGVIIPKATSYVPRDEVETVVALEDYFNKESVTTKSGSYPVLQNPTDTFATVAELEENPKLAAPKFREVKWEVETHRGALPISQEAIDDSQVDLTALIAKQLQRRKINTKNKDIVAKLATFTAVTPTAKEDVVDFIKKIINVQLDPGYSPQIICTQSMFQLLDTLKDKQGQYILHQDISTSTGASLLGLRVIKVKDTLLGTAAGDQVMFIGDPNAITTFDRLDAEIEWINSEIYGRHLIGVTRFDVETSDPNAGFLVKLTTTP